MYDNVFYIHNLIFHIIEEVFKKTHKDQNYKIEEEYSFYLQNAINELDKLIEDSENEFELFFISNEITTILLLLKNAELVINLFNKIEVKSQEYNSYVLSSTLEQQKKLYKAIIV